jgi:hypothetical protein
LVGVRWPRPCAGHTMRYQASSFLRPTFLHLASCHGHLACAAPPAQRRAAFAATPLRRRLRRVRRLRRHACAATPAPPRLTPRRRALPRARVSASSAALRSTRRAQARRSNGGQPRRPREATPRWHFFLGVGFPAVNWGSIRYLFAAANQAIVSPRSHPACAG